MQQDITWTVTQPDGKTTVTGPEREKIPYYAPMPMKGLDDTQKIWFTKFNNMQKRLMELGEMESK